MKTPKTISHIRVLNDSFEFQSNEEHQQGVAKMAAEFADAFSMKKYGELLGLLHDKGKEQESFQVMSEKVCKILLVLSPMLGKPKHEGNL